MPDRDGWRLYGRKWFTSAVTSQMALTLARPEGNAPGGKGLAMFYVEVRDAGGKLNGIRVDRLKDKLGTRKVPTAELTLDGTRAVAGRCARQWHARDRADAGRDAHVEQRVCRVVHASRAGTGAVVRGATHRVRPAARTIATARRHARRRWKRKPGARS